MASQLKNITCSNHICNRIAEVIGTKDCALLRPFLSLQKTDGSEFVDFNIPIKTLQNVFKVTRIEPIITMKTDSVIQKIGENPDIGSIFFKVKKDEFMKSVMMALRAFPAHLPEHKKRTILVEYSSPNIAKPFHVGHLRSTIVGNYVSNILEKSHIIKRVNYLGDWGTQIGFVKAGLESSNISDVNILDNPMRGMYNAYTLANSDPNTVVKAREMFSNFEKGMSTNDWLEEWEKIRSLTITHLKETYKSFGVVFDEYSFESDYRAENISPMVELLKEKNLISIHDGCLALNFDDKKVPLFKSDGATLYLARDIAAALDRIKKYKCDEMLYVVDKSQAGHFNNLKYAVSKLAPNSLINHIPFGRITGMSTRKGTSVFLDDILNETVNKMFQQQQKSPNTRTLDTEVTKVLGVTALIIYILKQRRTRDFSFCWKNAMMGTGDSGVKLQYTHCRLHSIYKHNSLAEPEEVDPKAFKEDIAFDLIYELARYPEVLRESQQNLESCFLVIYLFKLCNLVSRCIKKLPVKGENINLATQRLLLFNTTRSTIGSALKTLGIQPLDEM